MANTLRDAVTIVKQTVMQLGDTKKIVDACDQVAGFAARADELNTQIEALEERHAAQLREMDDAAETLQNYKAAITQARSDRAAAEADLAKVKEQLTKLKQSIGAI